MAFLIPVYTNEPFHVGETREGRIAIPADVYGTLERFSEETGATEAEVIEGKIWCRLSAPGYMDATDWDGPYDTESEAREAISNTFDVDADSGEDLE